MVRSLKILEAELADLDRQASALAEAIYQQYSSYSKLLGTTAQKQLILAAYQLCTQIYPESFLKLSYSQREQLQSRLRQLSHDIGTQLQSALQSCRPVPPTSESEPSAIAPSTPANDESLPDRLVMWCQYYEKEIGLIFDRISQEANRLLQQAAIVPIQLPSKLFEAAFKAEESGGTLGSQPNMMDLLVEKSVESDVKSQKVAEKSQVTHITAIHLRLSEIEFNDAPLTRDRQQIRQLHEQLGQLQQRYERTQRERATAQAESAWRSSWHEDSL